MLILSDRSESFWADLFKLHSCLEDLECALFEKEQCQIRFCLFKFQQLQNKVLNLLNYTFEKYCVELTNRQTICLFFAEAPSEYCDCVVSMTNSKFQSLNQLLNCKLLIFKHLFVGLQETQRRKKKNCAAQTLPEVFCPAQLYLRLNLRVCMLKSILWQQVKVTLTRSKNNLRATFHIRK